MIASLSFLCGFACCALIWAYKADESAAEKARREDQHYLRGWQRGAEGKPPQTRNIQ